jgi:hypothetical protein
LGKIGAEKKRNWKLGFRSGIYTALSRSSVVEEVHFGGRDVARRRRAVVHATGEGDEEEFVVLTLIRGETVSGLVLAVGWAVYWAEAVGLLVGCHGQVSLVSHFLPFFSFSVLFFCFVFAQLNPLLNSVIFAGVLIMLFQ